MPKLHVAFDTNIYRSLSQERFEALRRLERDHAVTSVASYYVAAELLSHLASATDSSFYPSWAALRRLVIHSRYYKWSFVLPFVGDVDAQIAYIMFNHRFPDNQENAYVAGLCGAACESNFDGLMQYRDTFIELAEQVTAAEQAFVQNIWQTIVLALVPNAKDWSDLTRDKVQYGRALRELASAEADRVMAEILVARVVEKIGKPLSAEERTGKVEEVLQAFTPAIRFHNALLSRIIRDGLDLRRSKHSNTLWDIHIAFAASTFAHLGRTPLWLVTNDSPVLNAARDTGMDWAVHSLDEYEAALRQYPLVVRPR